MKKIFLSLSLLGVLSLSALDDIEKESASKIKRCEEDYQMRQNRIKAIDVLLPAFAQCGQEGNFPKNYSQQVDLLDDDIHSLYHSILGVAAYWPKRACLDGEMDSCNRAVKDLERWNKARFEHERRTAQIEKAKKEYAYNCLVRNSISNIAQELGLGKTALERNCLEVQGTAEHCESFLAVLEIANNAAKFYDDSIEK